MSHWNRLVAQRLEFFDKQIAAEWGNENRCQFVTQLFLNPCNCLYLQKVCDFIQRYEIICLLVPTTPYFLLSTDPLNKLRVESWEVWLPLLLVENWEVRVERYDYLCNCAKLPKGCSRLKARNTQNTQNTRNTQNTQKLLTNNTP